MNCSTAKCIETHRKNPAGHTQPPLPEYSSAHRFSGEIPKTWRSRPARCVGERQLSALVLCRSSSRCTRPNVESGHPRKKQQNNRSSKQSKRYRSYKWTPDSIPHQKSEAGNIPYNTCKPPRSTAVPQASGYKHCPQNSEYRKKTPQNPKNM